MAVPILYFGIQLLAAPFFPGYSFLRCDASTLGSDGSSFPLIFNVGAIIQGGVTLIAAWGFVHAFRLLGVNAILTWLTSLAVIVCGLASMNAGVFPLPDPRHTEGPLAIVGIGMLLLPVLLPAALWKLPDSRRLKVYFIVNLIAFVALIPIMSGLIQRMNIMMGVDIPGYQSFLNNCQGLLQRIVALIVIGPIGVASWALARYRNDSTA